MSKNIFTIDVSKYFTNTIETSFFIKNISQKETQENKKKYLELLLQDRTGVIYGTIWEENIRKEYVEYKNQVVQIKGMVTQNPNASYQLVISGMELLKSYKQDDYVNGISKEESQKYMNLLWKYISNVKSDSFRMLLEHIFQSEPDFATTPATLISHHNYDGGLLVHTISVTMMVNYLSKSLEKYNLLPSHSLPYNMDLLITSGLLHYIGTLRMYTPFPEMGRVSESIPLSRYEHTMQYLQQAVLLCENLNFTPEDQSLLFHTIGCVYENTERKPMMREPILLREAVQIQIKTSCLEHFLTSSLELGKEGILFDSMLNNYIYVDKKEKTNE